MEAGHAGAHQSNTTQGGPRVGISKLRKAVPRKAVPKRSQCGLDGAALAVKLGHPSDSNHSIHIRQI